MTVKRIFETRLYFGYANKVGQGSPCFSINLVLLAVIIRAPKNVYNIAFRVALINCEL